MWIQRFVSKSSCVSVTVSSGVGGRILYKVIKTLTSSGQLFLYSNSLDCAQIWPFCWLSTELPARPLSNSLTRQCPRSLFHRPPLPPHTLLTTTMTIDCQQDQTGQVTMDLIDYSDQSQGQSTLQLRLPHFVSSSVWSFSLIHPDLSYLLTGAITLSKLPPARTLSIFIFIFYTDSVEALWSRKILQKYRPINLQSSSTTLKQLLYEMQSSSLTLIHSA